MEVEMKIRGLMMDPVTSMPIVILKDVGSNHVLPIWVGIYEANATGRVVEVLSVPAQAGRAPAGAGSRSSPLQNK